MTEKRFEYLGLGEYWDNQEDNELESKEVTELLNALNDENNQLHQRITLLIEKYLNNMTEDPSTLNHYFNMFIRDLKELEE